MKMLVLWTTLIALVIFGGFVFYENQIKDVKIETNVAPGKAELVLYEDFRCFGCRTFNQEILPKIRAKYGKTDKIEFKFVILAFLKDSKSLGNAALEVLHQTPDRFEAYSYEIFSHVDEIDKDNTDEMLIQLAEKVGGIDIVSLKTCMEAKCHYAELDQNLQKARAIMGKHLQIPTLFINGSPVSVLNYQAIQKRIDQAIGS